MLRISFQTLRARRGTLAGAFVAIWLAVTLAYATGLLMDAALSPPGPGRFAAADAVVQADPSIQTADGETENVIPSPRLDADLVQRFDGAVGDISFAVGAWDAQGRRLSGDPLHAHGWASAPLTPYRLISGRAPTGAHDVVVDERLKAGDRVRIGTPVGESTYRVTGRVRGSSTPTLFFADRVAARLSGTPQQVNAIVIRGEVPRVVAPLEVLDREHAADADAGDPRSADRAALVAIFGTMGGIAGLVALFVVAGTFTLAIVQRRREVAVMRALGAAPHQIRRLIAGEALIVSLVAGALGLLAGEPLAHAIVALLSERDVVPTGFTPGSSWIPLAAALGGAILIPQLAVFAAARRAGRTRPAEALRDAAIERPRPSVLQIVTGLLFVSGGVAMALVFKGMWAIAFAILVGLVLAIGVGLLGRVLLGVPAAILARPLRGLGAAGLLASTSLSANRWRTAALATPIVLVAMLAGTQAVVQSSSQQDVERVSEARVTAPYVVTGRDDAPIPPTRISGTAVAPTSIYPEGASLGEEAPWPAAGIRTRGAAGLDLGFDLARVRGDDVAVSTVFAEAGDLRVGETFVARMADTSRRTLRVTAIYDRAAGIGDVLVSKVPAPTAAIFTTERTDGAITRDQYLAGLHSAENDDAWAVWMIIGLAALFTALALINTAAMATAERRGELATIRLLGGTTGHAIRMIVLEMVPTVLVALGAGAAVVAVSVYGIPSGLTGVPLAVPVPLVAGITVGAAVLGLLAALVATRIALRTSPAEAMRE